MLLAGTDSIMYKSEAEDVYENFYKDKKLFDFSNHPKDYSKLLKILQTCKELNKQNER